MTSLIIRNNVYRLIHRTFFHNVARTCTCLSINKVYGVNITSKSTATLSYSKLNYYSVRQKSKKAQHDSDDEEEYNDEDSSLSKDSKVSKFSTTSMRTDGILKHALGIPRNKIEQIFYESKIRVNGKKILKKSASIKAGDEIDVIKAISQKNSNHLHVSRVEILNITLKDDSIQVAVRKFKSLLIENYEIDPYKASDTIDNEK